MKSHPKHLLSSIGFHFYWDLPDETCRGIETGTDIFYTLLVCKLKYNVILSSIVPLSMTQFNSNPGLINYQRR